MVFQSRYRMLFEFSELDWLFNDSEDIPVFLDRLADVINKNMRIRRCSVYLLDESTNQLVRMADSRTEEKGRQRHIKPDGGTCWKALEERCILFGDRKRSKMASPIMRGDHELGVLVVESKRKPFTRLDERIINLVSIQMANILENARTSLTAGKNALPEPAQVRLDFSAMMFLSGTGASPGLAFAESFTLDRKRILNDMHRTRYEKIYTSRELDDAIEKTAGQLAELQHKVDLGLSDSASLIFTSHLMMLQDNGFRDQIRHLISAGLNPPAALLAVTEKYISTFRESDIPLIREKVDDLEDLTLRILSNLTDDSSSGSDAAGKIVIARNLYPSDILTLAAEKAAGIILVSGGITAHIAILAQSLKLPLVITDFPDLMNAAESLPVLIDGTSGKICLRPDDNVRKEIEQFRKMEQKVSGGRRLKKQTETRDGEQISLLANINIIPDLEEAAAMNFEGVGLYRTEFPFLIRRELPTEEEQYRLYRQVVTLCGDRTLTFRTIDIGGDKLMSYYQDYKEENPFLGLRSTRFALKNPVIFRRQIRAILRAAGGRRIKLMFPMVSSIEEFKTARELVSECLEELIKDGDPAVLPEIGAMIEVPSLLEVIDELCSEADFLSIGTNDFIQYMLAVDRNNEKLTEYYTPHNPAILRSLAKIAAACNSAGVPLTICGEMAHQKEYIPFLLGIGIRSLSVSSSFLHPTQRFVQGIRLSEAEETARAALAETSIGRIEEILGI